ncbi:hypothetical protein J31TS6_11450 [Brevibacillus reuszeri]|nr:hypothetical protein J31TS6_11450 [Brevibacillus reuszeri]
MEIPFGIEQNSEPLHLKQLLMTKSFVILTLTMAAVVNAQSPSSPSEQPKMTFTPNAKPTGFSEKLMNDMKKLPHHLLIG